MTCIVGIRTSQGVVLAGDAVGVDGGGPALTRRDPKVFALNKHVAIGYTSSYRMGQLLRFNLRLPSIVDAVGDARSQDLFEWAVKEFVPNARECFKDGGFASTSNGVETGGYFLLAVRDRLFHVQSDFQVGEPERPYEATGSGENVALGALYALVPDPPKGLTEARSAANKALDAASEHCAYVRGPYTLVETKP